MTRKTTKIRAFERDNDYLKILALKVSARREKITTTAEVLNEIIKIFNNSGKIDIDEASEQIKSRFPENL